MGDVTTEAKPGSKPEQFRRPRPPRKELAKIRFTGSQWGKLRGLPRGPSGVGSESFGLVQEAYIYADGKETEIEGVCFAPYKGVTGCLIEVAGNRPQAAFSVRTTVLRLDEKNRPIPGEIERHKGAEMVKVPGYERSFQSVTQAGLKAQFVKTDTGWVLEVNPNREGAIWGPGLYRGSDNYFHRVWAPPTVAACTHAASMLDTGGPVAKFASLGFFLARAQEGESSDLDVSVPDEKLELKLKMFDRPCYYGRNTLYEASKAIPNNEVMATVMTKLEESQPKELWYWLPVEAQLMVQTTLGHVLHVILENKFHMRLGQIGMTPEPEPTDAEVEEGELSNAEKDVAPTETAAS